MKHAKLSASSSHRWLTCPASVKACEGYANTSTPYAEWGTCCHGVGELMLKGQDVNIGDKVEGIVVDREILETAEAYVDYCRSLMSKDSEVIIEGRFDFSHIVPDGFGTSDCTIIDDGTLHVVDLKTGFNLVDAKENSQLMLYALGAIHEIGFIHDIEKIELHIVQTRANGHISSWETTPDALNTWAEWVEERASITLTDDAPFQPETKACKYCLHQANCDALREHVEGIVKGDFDDLDALEGHADKIDSDHLKRVLDNADLIEGFVKACKQVALERMESGESIDGYKLVASRTNRRWKDEAEVEKYLKGKLKVGEMYSKKLAPMTTLLKLRPNDKKLEAMLEKPEGKPTLAPISDKRPELESVKEMFDRI